METEPLYITDIYGAKIYLDKPKGFKIEAIAKSLSHICRWGGGLPQHWSVGQHSLTLCHLLLEDNRPYAAYCALMHDCAEAYVGDIPRPIVKYLGEPIIRLKSIFEKALEAEFGYSHEESNLKFWDDQIIHVEVNMFGVVAHKACQDGYALTLKQHDEAYQMMGVMLKLPMQRIAMDFLDMYQKLKIYNKKNEE